MTGEITIDALLLALMKFGIIGVVLHEATKWAINIVKPYVDIKKYALTVAFVLSALTIVAFNNGILTTLGVPIETTRQTMFLFVDILLTSLVMTGGAKSVRSIAKGIQMYRESKKDTTK